jgi:hypothetical protein
MREWGWMENWLACEKLAVKINVFVVEFMGVFF